MKRILALTTATLMGASMLAAPAFAGQNESGMRQDGAQFDAMERNDDGQALTPDIDTGTTAAIGGSFDGALSAIGNNATNAQSIGTMTEVDTVEVVRVGDLEGSDPARVEEAVSQNADGVDTLRSSIEANAALSQELEAQGVDPASVVAAEIGVDGEVVVYVM